MKLGLLDMGSDDVYETNYAVEPEILDYVKEPENSEIAGQMLFFIFVNKRAEDFMAID